MQIYKQQVDIADILKQTDEEQMLRMHNDGGFSILLPDSIHLDIPYHTIRITENDIGETEAEEDSAQATVTEEVECPTQPFPNSWFSEHAHQNPNALKSEYRAYAKKYHPDVCENEKARKAFLTIKEEYEIILNEIC